MSSGDDLAEFAAYLEMEIEIANEEESKEVIGEPQASGSIAESAANLEKEIDEDCEVGKIKEAIQDEVLKDVEDDIEPGKQSKNDVMDGSTGEEKLKVPAGEISDGVNVACSHPVIVKSLCSTCGKLVEECGSTVAFSYIHPDIRLKAPEIERLCEDNMKKLLKDKKLILVLDLDLTLLNTVLLDDLTQDEAYLLHIPNEMKALGQFSVLDECCMITKLRPFVHSFLKEANEMFEMYISTMGSQRYVSEILPLLDPEGMYFPSRVISRSDHTAEYKKGLDMVLGTENIIIILDDTEDVWEGYEANLIVMEKYRYFAHDSNWKSLSVSRTDENESDGALANILQVLKLAHKLFYSSTAEVNPASRDVRQILASIKKDVLQDCNILFSGVSPSNEQLLQKLAEGMGAIYSPDMDDLVTHVVTEVPTTMEVQWAIDNNIFVVNTRWFQAAHYHWQRPNEEKFPVR